MRIGRRAGRRAAAPPARSRPPASAARSAAFPPRPSSSRCPDRSPHPRKPRTGFRFRLGSRAPSAGRRGSTGSRGAGPCSWWRAAAGSVQLQRLLLRLDQLCGALHRQLEHLLHLFRLEWFLLGGSLDLDETSVLREHAIHVRLGGEIFEVVEVKPGLPLHDADADRRNEMLDGQHPQQVALDGLLQGEVERDESTGDRRSPRTAVGLQDVTVDHDGALAHQGHIDGSAERATDQPLDLLGAAIDPTCAGFARGPRLGCPGQHRVLGGYPPFPRTLLVRWRLVVPAGRAQHPGVAHVDQARPLAEKVQGVSDLPPPDLVRFPAVGSRLSQRRLSSQSADHEDADLEQDDQRNRQQGGRDRVNTRRHHGGPGKDADPELESLAGKGPGADDAGQAEHGHGQGQLEGDPENRDEDQDKVDVAAGQWQVLDLARPKSDEEPQGNRHGEEGKADPDGKQEHRGRDEPQGEASFVSMQSGRDEGPDLPEDDRAGENEAGKHPDLEIEEELVDGMFTGFILTSPVILWQVWTFVAPGLHRNERRFALGFVTSAVLLFAMGIGFAFFAMPIALRFLIGFGTTEIQYFPLASSYINFVLILIAIFGVTFELPLAMTMLGLAGIVSARTLSSQRFKFWIGIFAGAAMVTPGVDPVTPTLLAAPLIILVEMSILVIRALRRSTALAQTPPAGRK